MPFWSQTTAAPAWWHTTWRTLSPQYLRPTPLPEMPAQITLANNVVATVSLVTRILVADVAAFWETHYGGADWKIIAHDWIHTYINDSRVIVLCFRIPDVGIIGTIVSTPATNGITHMSHGAELRSLRVIEGLCVHPDYRSKGVAGSLIQCMDAYTSNHCGPTVHLWSRELMLRLPFSSALQTYRYGYITSVAAEPRTSVLPLPWDRFAELWKQCSGGWARRYAPCIVTDLPLNRRGGLTVWITRTGQVREQVVVISDTKRYSGIYAMYEVVWCGVLERGSLLYPASPNMDYGATLETIVAEYFTGMLFTTDEYVHTWSAPWVYGSSGYHAWYIYNYLPPAFRTCKLHMIREEI
jgi:hypothetical protein